MTPPAAPSQAQKSGQIESHAPGTAASVAKHAAVCWLRGLQKALCLHRCLVFFVHDHAILVKTGQCLALNGAIFLGSILAWDWALLPLIGRLLAASLRSHAAYEGLLHGLLRAVFGAVWLVPVYLVSFPLSCAWCSEVAELAFRVEQARASGASGAGGAAAPARRPVRKAQDPMLLVAQELFRTVLFAVFFLQTAALGLLPWVGPALRFAALSWLNALYSFDYQWGLARRSLQERMRLFERHWAFFAGFGSVCTLATVACPFFAGAALSAAVYPFCILLACGVDPAAATAGASPQPRLPIFSTSVRATVWLIARGPDLLQAPALLWRHRLPLTAALLAAACAMSAPLLLELARSLTN